MTKQVSAEAREAAEEIRKLRSLDFSWGHYSPMASDVRQIIQAAIDKSRATLPSAGDGKDSERLDWLLSPNNMVMRITDEENDDWIVERDQIDAAMPSPPPPQPAAEWTAEQQCHRALSSLYLAVDKSIADDVKKHVMERMEELERRHARELADANTFCEELQLRRDEAALGNELLRTDLAKSQSREADLTAAREADLEAMRTALDYLVMPVDTEARIAKEKIQERLAVRIKPASALTATKEEK